LNLDFGVSLNKEAWGYKLISDVVHGNMQVYLAERNSFIIGMISVSLSPFIYNPTKLVGSELFWYIEPNHRHRHKVGIKLKQLAEQYARDVGCYFMNMSTLNDTSDGIKRHYLKNGYTKIQEQYLKVL